LLEPVQNLFYQQPSLGRWLSPDPAGFTDGMNLYCFVHNNPLTHFDEYGLLDFGQWDNPKEYQQNCQQLSLGVNQGLVNAGFGGIRLANAIGHGVAAPFHCYDFRAGRFNFSMGRSYSAINGWTHQRQNMINQRWIRGADYNHRAFQTGSVLGNFVGDWALGGALIKRAVGMVRGGINFGFNKLAKAPAQVETAIKLSSQLKWPSPGTGRSVIDDILYTTHALERMSPRGLIQSGTEIISRGVPPSVVKNAINFGSKRLGNSSHF
jgi:hypothetical protein